MRRTFYFLFLLFFALGLRAQQAKYVFFFIGDGMGLNQVNTTEMLRAELQGRIGTEPLLFATFPVAGMATTYSATNAITDSAAGGTALATGSKTYNDAIGVDTAGVALRSVAERAKAAGRRVGIATSVSIDHATPAAFYAHQRDRHMYYEIALDLPRAGFDFYAGSGFLSPETDATGQPAPSIFPLIEEAGYVVARGQADYESKAAKAQRLVLMQADGADPASLPYAIDRREGDLTLAQITEDAIAFLTRDRRSKGFFVMIEGGKIDWACHNNDLATVCAEVNDLDAAIRVAYEFYEEHPRETLIIVTADHETGGLGMGRDGYTLALRSLATQTVSEEALSRAVTNLRRQGNVAWDDVRRLLSDTMGFWSDLPLTWEQEKSLRDAYEQSFVQRKVVFEESLYATIEPLAAAAKRVMSELALAGWTTGDHTAAYVPVFAVGAGAELFSGKMDNTDIPRRVARAAGY